MNLLQKGYILETQGFRQLKHYFRVLAQTLVTIIFFLISQVILSLFHKDGVIPFLGLPYKYHLLKYDLLA